jgi:hypothetical protein
MQEARGNWPEFRVRFSLGFGSALRTAHASSGRPGVSLARIRPSQCHDAMASVLNNLFGGSKPSGNAAPAKAADAGKCSQTFSPQLVQVQQLPIHESVPPLHLPLDTLSSGAFGPKFLAQLSYAYLVLYTVADHRLPQTSPTSPRSLSRRRPPSRPLQTRSAGPRPRRPCVPTRNGTDCTSATPGLTSRPRESFCA